MITENLDNANNLSELGHELRNIENQLNKVYWEYTDTEPDNKIVISLIDKTVQDLQAFIQNYNSGSLRKKTRGR